MPLKCWAHCQKIVPWSGDPGGKNPGHLGWVDPSVKASHVNGQVSNEKRAPGCSFRMPVGARSGVPTYHRYLLFFFFSLIQGAFFWVGVGWVGDVNVPCTCTHDRCDAIGCFLHLHTYLMLRHRMFLVGLGWGGDVNVPCTCEGSTKLAA